MAETGKKKGKGWVYALIGIALVGGGFAAWYFLRKRKDGDSSTINVENSSTTSTTTITSGGGTGSMGGSVVSGTRSGSIPRVNITVWPLKYIAPPAPVDPRVKTLQSAINKYASAKGISKSYLPLDVDGKFGSKTQQAVQELSKAILGVSTSTISEGQFNTIKKYA